MRMATRSLGETVTLSSGGTMTDNNDGTYTGTVTSTTTAGNRTITATDGGISGQATLTQTAGPAAHVALSLQPSSIVANGTSTSTATATVTDANGNPISGETVTLSSGATNFGSMSDQGDGTYTSTVTSTTTAGNRTFTATDGSISGQATLTQRPGPATHAALSLQPTSIVANGISETTATLTVTDAHGNRVPGETITFTSSDTGQLPGQVTDNGDGTYSAQIRSSATVGQATIKGTDARANIAGQAMLTQVNSPSTSTLAVSPSPAVTNQPVTLLAAIQGSGTSARHGQFRTLGCSDCRMLEPAGVAVHGHRNVHHVVRRIGRYRAAQRDLLAGRNVDD